MKTPEGGYMRDEDAWKQRPTGVWNYERVELNTLMPLLGDIPLAVYWQLRIACCGRLLVRGEATLLDCGSCYENLGFVCPSCRAGRGWLSGGAVQYGLRYCPTCTYDYVDDHKHLHRVQDAERILSACNRWLTRHFPYGVPSEPTPAELAEMGAR